MRKIFEKHEIITTLICLGALLVIYFIYKFPLLFIGGLVVYLVYRYNRRPQKSIQIVLTYDPDDNEGQIQADESTNRQRTEVEPPKPICPHCKGKLEKVPQRKKKCPLCGKPMLVRRYPDTNQRLLVTEGEAKEIDNLWHKRYEKEKWMDDLQQYGIGEKDYKKHQVKLAKAWGKEPNQRDVLWSIFNTLLVGRRDLQEMAGIYSSMASFLDEEGKDFSEVLEEHHRTVLQDLKQHGFTKVIIKYSGGGLMGCDACKAQDGKTYLIDDALREMPLPCKSCSYIMGGKSGFCRCFYQAD